MTSTLKDNKPTRVGSCAIRSASGMPVLDETYSFIVICTTNDEPYDSVLLTPGLPQVGINISPTGYGVCRSVRATRRDKNPKIWDVICEYSSEVEERTGQQNPTQDPTVWVPVYETKYEKIQESLVRDKSNVAIANSAGQPFANGIIVNRKIPVWEFFQIEPPYDDEVIIERSETVNSIQFRNRPAKSLLLTVLKSTVGFYYGARRRLTQYELKYNKKLWTHKRLDIGTVYLDGTFDSFGAVQQPYLDKSGRVINGGLDGSGGRVTHPDPPEVLEFDEFDEIDFNQFLRV